MIILTSICISQLTKPACTSLDPTSCTMSTGRAEQSRYCQQTMRFEGGGLYMLGLKSIQQQRHAYMTIVVALGENAASLFYVDSVAKRIFTCCGSLRPWRGEACLAVAAG